MRAAHASRALKNVSLPFPTHATRLHVALRRGHSHHLNFHLAAVAQAPPPLRLDEWVGDAPPGRRDAIPRMKTVIHRPQTPLQTLPQTLPRLPSPAAPPPPPSRPISAPTPATAIMVVVLRSLRRPRGHGQDVIVDAVQLLADGEAPLPRAGLKVQAPQHRCAPRRPAAALLRRFPAALSSVSKTGPSSSSSSSSSRVGAHLSNVQPTKVPLTHIPVRSAQIQPHAEVVVPLVPPPLAAKALEFHIQALRQLSGPIQPLQKCKERQKETNRDEQRRR